MGWGKILGYHVQVQNYDTVEGQANTTYQVSGERVPDLRGALDAHGIKYEAKQPAVIIITEELLRKSDSPHSPITSSIMRDLKSISVKNSEYNR